MNKQKSASLTDRTVVGFTWLFSSSLIQNVLRVSVTVILARLLTPEDFGIVGAALVVIGISNVFTNLGLTQALVQIPNLEVGHQRASLFVSFLLGWTIFGLLQYQSSTIEDFFRINGLAIIVEFLAWTFPILAIGAVAEARLARDLEYKRISIIELIAYLLGYGVLGVILAISGFGIWSLLYAYMSRVIVVTLLYQFLRPSFSILPFELSKLRPLLKFGAGFSIARVGNFTANQLDSVIVGRYLGAEALGLYGRATQFIKLPTNILGTVIDRALFPAMASVQSEHAKISRAFHTAVGLIALVAFPISIMAFLLAERLVLILLGSNWIELTPVFKVLSMIIFFKAGYKVSDSLSRALGAVYRRAWRQWIFAGAVAFGAYIGHFWGLVGVAYGVAFAVFLNFILMTSLSILVLKVSFKLVLYIVLKHILISCVVILPIYGLYSEILDGKSEVTFVALFALSVAFTYLLILVRFSKRIGEETVFLRKIVKRMNEKNAKNKN